MARKIRWILVVLVVTSLAACNAFAGAAPTPLPTVVLDQGGSTPQARPPVRGSSGGVVASGVVAPAEQANLVFTISGKVEAVEAAVGQAVQEGDVLVRLQGKEDLQAAIAAADLALATAQKELDDLKQNASGARTTALERISTATKAVRDATYQLDNFTIPADQAGLDTRQALSQTEARLNEARTAFEPYRYYPSTHNVREDLLDKLNEAQAAYNAAVRRLQYETELEVARADLQDALKDFEMWDEGPDPAELAIAEKRLANAQAAADAARAQLKNLELHAPFSGAIIRVDVHRGEWAVAGDPVIAMADLARLRIETTDLSERDIPQVSVGQAVMVYIEALDQQISGRVSEIAPLADTLGGDVVYKTTIDLDEIPARLRAGMSVEVQFTAQ